MTDIVRALPIYGHRANLLNNKEVNIYIFYKQQYLPPAKLSLKVSRPFSPSHFIENIIFSFSKIDSLQPRSQSLSPFPPWSSRIETLVGPGHVSPKIWVTKKIGREGGVGGYFNRFFEKSTIPEWEGWGFCLSFHIGPACTFTISSTTGNNDRQFGFERDYNYQTAFQSVKLQNA